MLILEVDDDSDDREFFLEAVNSIDSDISCEQVESGVVALEYLNASQKLPDFIFMDVNMPKMTGYECVNLIRSIPRLTSVQIIMYSTSFDPEERKSFVAKGIKFLSKTSRFADIRARQGALILKELRRSKGCLFFIQEAVQQQTPKS